MNLFVCQETDHWQQGIPFPQHGERDPWGAPGRDPIHVMCHLSERANGGRSDDIMWTCQSTNSQTARPMSGLGLMFYLDRLIRKRCCLPMRSGYLPWGGDTRKMQNEQSDEAETLFRWSKRQLTAIGLARSGICLAKP